uniref:Uncharacterized protein n=1 Tax=Setaria viridis TaxID=4556 RepID=A0A4U6UQM8_SETVI|nr:hypothetical protein SEVIR_5G286850v2 [Setaria viridis]
MAHLLPPFLLPLLVLASLSQGTPLSAIQSTNSSRLPLPVAWF